MQFAIFDAEIHTVYQMSMSQEVEITKKIFTED
jgi:hypothetical protein